jgi:cytochrome c oxidase subunit 2
MFTGLVFLAVIIGSIVFHVWTPWWWTDIASNWSAMDDTIILSFWIGGGVFILVCLFMVYCIFRYQYKEGRRSEYKPEDKKLEKGLTWLTTIGVVALLAPGLVVWNNYIRVPDNAIQVEVMAWQWGWKYRLPGQDGKLGASNNRIISDDNPYGLNIDDPNGKDDVFVESNELHLLKDRPVKILLRSIDVLHNFYVPQFRSKMDAVPGTITYYWFEPNKNGEYEVLCAEYCGVAHYAMRGKVVVEDEGSYNKWLSEQETFSSFTAKNRNNKLNNKKFVKINNLSSDKNSILKEQDVR